MPDFNFILKIPNILGESTRVGHTGQIDITSVQWGFGRAISPTTGLPAGKVLPKVVSVSKRIDRSSAPIGNLAATRAAQTVEIFAVDPLSAGSPADIIWL